MMADRAATVDGGVDQWLDVLAARHSSPIDLELTRIEKTRRALGLTLSMPVATIGGTNGKGSVCNLLAAMLRAGGARVGCYTSPHLLRFHERINIDGAVVDDATLLAAFARVEKARLDCGVSLTYFEFTTLAAALIFSDAEVEVAVLEVGLGGRLDAVNIFSPTVAAVTNIGFDHQEFLGDNIEAIAFEKSGIFRPGVPAMVGDHNAPPTLLTTVADAHVHVAGRDFGAQTAATGWHYYGRRQLFSLPPPAMRGRHQLSNAALALAILEQLPDDLWPGIGAVRQGLHTVAVAGRGQVLPGQPTTVLDVAHNAAAAAILERMLFDMGYYERTTAILGMMARKNAAEFVRALHRRVDVWHIVCPSAGDLSATDLANTVKSVGAAAVVCDSMAAAKKAAHDYCGNNGRIVITGSFMTVADYMQIHE